MVSFKTTRGLETDSLDYHLITNAINAIPDGVCGMACEVGVRRGGGSRFIMDALSARDFAYKVLVCIDPYGNIEYAYRESLDTRLDYTNDMRDETMGPLYTHGMNMGVNVVFFTMEDTEFFDRFHDYVPVYSEYKCKLDTYMFVHFDGPHQLQLLIEEFDFFNERMPEGATIVFDDLAHYRHNKLEEYVFQKGWKLLEKTGRKASYQKGNSDNRPEEA